MAILLGLGAHARGSLAEGWLALRIPASRPDFADTRIITHAIDCVIDGQDPYTSCSLDPWKRVYNYPPVWLQLKHLGVSSSSTEWLGAGLALMAIAAVVTLFPSKGWVSSIVAFAAVFSWPLLFGIERGNTDLLIFSMSVLALLGMHRMSARHEQLGRELLIVALTVLKLYPIAMALLFIRGRVGGKRAFAVGVASALGVFATSMHRLRAVFVNTPTDHGMSFGSYDTLRSIQPYLPPVLSGHMGEGGRTVAMLLAALGGAAAAVYGDSGGRLVRKFLIRFDTNTGIGAVAASGLAVYCLTYILGANYDYRLLFLLAPLGLLVRDLANSGSLRSLPMSLLLLADLLSLYARGTTLPHLLHPLLYVVACAWLGYSLLNPIGQEAAEDVVEAPVPARRSETAILMVPRTRAGNSSVA